MLDPRFACSPGAHRSRGLKKEAPGTPSLLPRLGLGQGEVHHTITIACVPFEHQSVIINTCGVKRPSMPS